MTAASASSEVEGLKTSMTECPSCGFSLYPIHQNGESELSINRYIGDLLTKNIQCQKYSSTQQEENNNLQGFRPGENGRVSFSDIVSEVENIISRYHGNATEIDKSADLHVGKVRNQQRKLKEELKKAKGETLQQKMDFIKTVEMKPEEDQELQVLIHQELTSSFDSEKIPPMLADEPDSHLKPEPLKTIDVKFAGEGHVAIQDLLVMNNEDRKVIVVSDYRNNCVKCIYVHEKETDCLKFPHAPFYLTRASDTTAATTFGKVKQIAIFQVIPELELGRIIETQIEYSGIQRLSASTFAVSRACAFKNGVIDIIDLSGTVLRSFGSDVLAAPYFIDIAGCGRIVASDSSKRTIVCFTNKGQIRFMYRPTDDRMLSCPRGLKRHGESIYIVDEDGNKVIQLSERGEFVKDLLTSDDGLNVPRAIDVDDDRMVYVSVLERYIKVFQLP